MSEPKRGKHCGICKDAYPNCPCNTCQRDDYTSFMEAADWCCDGKCDKTECKRYVKDEPTKKGAEK